MKKNIVGIILAAGEGTRMSSELPKVVHRICGQPMLTYMLELLSPLRLNKCIVVVGHKAEEVRAILKGMDKVETVKQQRLLGSADAVWQARDCLADFKGDVLVVYGDTPLITLASLQRLVEHHNTHQSGCTVLTAQLKNPSGFGRICRDEENRLMRIIEEQDADAYQKAIGEINVGAYCFDAKELFAALQKIKPDNAKKEYYLTDAVEVLRKKKITIESVCVQDAEEAQGINSRSDLAHACTVINKRNIAKLLSEGVTVVEPATTYIYTNVEVGCDTIIYPHTVIENNVRIGKGCKIGPFAHLRPATILEDEVEIGNFVEISRSKIGCGCKIKHHSFIGDAIIGKEANIGAGTITANYDGQKKNTVFIGEGAFIGVGTILIAPVKIGKKAITGAGSVVTKNKDVPAGATVVGIPARLLTKKRKKT